MVIEFNYHRTVIRKEDGNVNVNALKGRIVWLYGSQKKFADYLGWHQNKLSKMMNAKYIPDIDEASDIATALKLNQEEFYEIFLDK